VIRQLLGDIQADAGTGARDKHRILTFMMCRLHALERHAGKSDDYKNEIVDTTTFIHGFHLLLVVGVSEICSAQSIVDRLRNLE
jgi:hypothetical protein